MQQIDPIHLGDKLNDDENTKEPRYEVIHKLGSGGFSTIWLAHDLINGGYYVALKIVCASQSSYGGVPPTLESILNGHPDKILVTELRRFTISGPNGRHNLSGVATDRTEPDGIEPTPLPPPARYM
ncbi:hypothetical protein VTG60DRAFT_4437 [Thermothelomyces hinnuleus]